MIFYNRQSQKEGIIMKTKADYMIEMVEVGACAEEAEKAYQLFELLKPGLRIKKNGRVDTAWGDKTPLGLYRTIGSHIFS
jgi:hypothetical protein